MNSVIASLTPQSYVTRFDMLLGHPIYKKKILVIVEGDDDKKVYGRMFDKEVVDVRSIGGCNNFNDILTQLNPKYYPRLAVIKDADFEHIVGYEYTFPNLFRTDSHDVETMMMTDAFYEVFKMEYLKGKESELLKLMKVHDELLPLSWLKLACKDLGKNINFGAFSLYMFYKGNTDVDVDECRNVLNRKPENATIGVPTDSEIARIKSKYGEVDKSQLNNGHDICDGFAYKNKALGYKEISIDSLEKVLRTAFTMMQFEKTKLYAEMSAWANKEGLSLFRQS